VPDEDDITLPGLSRQDFLELLRRMDRGNRLGLDRLPDDGFNELWQYAAGLPRIGELVYAAASRASVSLLELLEGLARYRFQPTTYLIRTLTEEMQTVVKISRSRTCGGRTITIVAQLSKSRTRCV
jgi:hypothetical protein